MLTQSDIDTAHCILRGICGQYASTDEQAALVRVIDAATPHAVADDTFEHDFTRLLIAGGQRLGLVTA